MNLIIAGQKALDNFVKHQEEIEAARPKRTYDDCLECGQLIIHEGEKTYHKSVRTCLFLENYPEDEGKNFETEMAYGREFGWYIRIGGK